MREIAGRSSDEQGSARAEPDVRTALQQCCGPDLALTCYLFLTPTIYVLRMHRVQTLTVLARLLIGCSPAGAARLRAAAARARAARGLAAQHIVVLPTYHARASIRLWTGRSVGRRELPAHARRRHRRRVRGARASKTRGCFPDDLVSATQAQPDVRDRSVRARRRAAAIADARARRTSSPSRSRRRSARCRAAATSRARARCRSSCGSSRTELGRESRGAPRRVLDRRVAVERPLDRRRSRSDAVARRSRAGASLASRSPRHLADLIAAP